MIPQDIIFKIIKAGSLAPSADNGQPWRFKVTEEGIELYHKPGEFEKDLSILREVSLVGHGAVIENMKIAANYYSYDLNASLFPDPERPNLIAKLAITEQQEAADSHSSLYQYIGLRCTNRSVYNTIPLTKAEKEKLLQVAEEESEVSIQIIENTSQIKILAEAVSTNERIVLSNQFLHKYFFHLIRFGKQNNEGCQDGMKVSTLAMPKPAEIIFTLCQYWPIIKVLNNLGLAKKIAKQNSKIYAGSTAFGVLSIKKITPLTLIQTSKVMEKIWLTATGLGLQIQPLAAVPYYAREALKRQDNLFSQKQKSLLTDAYKNIKTSSGNEQSEISFVFRLGHGLPHYARTMRFPISKLIIG